MYRVCSWKNPGGTPRGRAGRGGRGGVRRGRGGREIPEGTPVTPRSLEKGDKEKTPSSGTKRGRQSIPVVSPAVVGRKRGAPDDSDLPEFDPDKFSPGQAAPVVRKGEEEYMVVVSGVRDTGLTGKYWADMQNLPARRSRKSVQQAKVREAPFAPRWLMCKVISALRS